MNEFIDAQYQPYSLEQSIRYHINQGAQEITLWLNTDSSEWDLAHPIFKRQIVNYLHSDNLTVRLVIPEVKYDGEVEEELWLLQKIGVELCRGKAYKKGIAAQLRSNERVTTLATTEPANLCPGDRWLTAGGVVISTIQEPLGQFIEFKIEQKAQMLNLIQDTIEVDTAFNGPFTQFGEKFWMHLIKKDERLTKWIANNQLKSINYSDRYIQSPQSLLFITQIIGAICQVKPEVESVKIETLFHEKDRDGRFLHNDWECQQDFIESYEYWFQYKTKVKPEFVCNSLRSDIAHRRKLTLEFASGEKLIVKFDQGVGYWKLKESYSKYETVRFDFAAQLAEQLSALQRLEKNLIVENSEEWSTDITYKKL